MTDRRMQQPEQAMPPILEDKIATCTQPSVFTPEALLDAARRQKGLVDASVPPVCVLDPDTDLTRHLRQTGRAAVDRSWACYHTRLLRMTSQHGEVGLIGGAVGAPFAVLVAEQLFACGCQLLISLTSAGQLRAVGQPPYFILIDRALRDEGTSYHYLPASRFAEAPADLLARYGNGLAGLTIVTGPTWTTDAPFRETAALIERHRNDGLLAVEMEAAALYALAQARSLPILCFALVTNQMATTANDFDKGASNGVAEALGLIDAVAARFHGRMT